MKIRENIHSFVARSADNLGIAEAKRVEETRHELLKLIAFHSS